MANSKNPTELFFQRMQRAGMQGGSLVQLMQNYFKANYALTDLPKRVADFVLFDQLVGVGNTNLNFFQGAFAVTRSNFPTNTFQLPQSEHAIILGIRFMEGANATLQATNWNYGVGDAIAKNGVYDVVVNGVKQATKVPFTVHLPGLVANGLTTDDEGMNWLMEPIVFPAQQEIAIQASFQAAIATATYNLRCELHGVRFIGG